MNELIKQLREALEKMTPAPWVKWDGHAEVFCNNDGENSSFSVSGNRILECDPDDLPDFDGDAADDEDAYQIQAENNAEGIAVLRNLVPQLLDALSEEKKK